MYFEDAIKTGGPENQMRIIDLTEIVISTL
jgi:hypothetical protein